MKPSSARFVDREGTVIEGAGFAAVHVCPHAPGEGCGWREPAAGAR